MDFIGINWVIHLGEMHSDAIVHLVPDEEGQSSSICSGANYKTGMHILESAESFEVESVILQVITWVKKMKLHMDSACFLMWCTIYLPAMVYKFQVGTMEKFLNILPLAH